MVGRDGDGWDGTVMGDKVVPTGYGGDLLARITAKVRTTRLWVARAASSEILALRR